VTCRLRSGHYLVEYAEWADLYGVTIELPCLFTTTSTVAGVRTVRCSWCWKRSGETP
jgi:hypothetical protein